MALRLSTLLRDRLMGEEVTTGTIEMVRTGATTITDAANGFITSGFIPGMVVYISVFDLTAAEDQYARVAIVAAGTLTIDRATLTTAEADDGLITGVPQAFKDIFTYGELGIYTGSQPASADDAPTGTLLLLISEASVVVTPGTSTNGLSWDAPVDGVLGKDSTAWSDVGLVTGTAGWFRFYTNGYDIDGDGCNFDGSVGTSGAQLNLSSVAIVLAATTTIDEFEVTLPANV